MIPHTFDTSFIIANRLSEFPDNFYLSDVVQLELIGSAAEERIVKKLQAIRKYYADENLLIVPNADDWLMAGKVLYWLQQGVKRRNIPKSNWSAKKVRNFESLKDLVIFRKSEI